VFNFTKYVSPIPKSNLVFNLFADSNEMPLNEFFKGVNGMKIVTVSRQSHHLKKRKKRIKKRDGDGIFSIISSR